MMALFETLVILHLINGQSSSLPPCPSIISNFKTSKKNPPLFSPKPIISLTSISLINLYLSVNKL